MEIDVRLFAAARAVVGRDEVTVHISEPGTVESLLLALGEAWPALKKIMPLMRVAVNQAFAEADTPLHAEDEVALIPPVAGGSGVGSGSLRSEPLDPSEVLARVRRDGAGAEILFVGRVRDSREGQAVTGLTYEAYGTMAEKVLGHIAQEVEAAYPGARVALCHRVGALAVGEVAVAIAVSAPHRDEAYRASREVIERIKVEVPIWKHELGPDGARWVGMGP